MVDSLEAIRHVARNDIGNVHRKVADQHLQRGGGLQGWSEQMAKTRDAVVKALGSKGSWFAEWEGEALPCVHEHWKSGDCYADPEISSRGRWPKFVAGLHAKGRVLVTRDHIVDGFPRGRRGYASVWEIESVSADQDALRFRFIRQIA
jgi:hypothetical protein